MGPAKRRRCAPKHRSRRPRKAAVGQLAQLDASPFAWFEARGPAAMLHGLIDDATSEPLALWFRPTEDLHGYVTVLAHTCRHVVSSLYTKLVNLCAGRSLRYYNGCSVYKRSDVLRWHVETTSFGYQAEFLTRLLQEGRSYVEVPVVSSDREGSGSVNLRNFLSVGHSLMKIAIRRLRVYLFK